MLISTIALALALLGQAALPIPPAKTAEIALRYNWPDGMAARVETEQSRERRSGETTTASSASLTVTMRAVAHPEGRVIRFEDLRFAGLPAGETPEGEPLMEQLAVLAVPDLVIDKEGEFVRLADVKRSKAALDLIFAPLLKDKDLKPGQQELIASVTSEEMLNALGAQEWTMLVAQWNGLDLAVGKPEAFDFEEPTPLAPDVPVKTQYRITLVSRVPCDEGAAAQSDCVLLELRSAPEAASLKALLTRVMKQVMAEDPGAHIAFERYDLVNTIRLVTEPATLRPHRLETEKRLDMVISAPDDPAKKHSASQIDRRTSRYVY